jgi:hypothetical protein
MNNQPDSTLSVVIVSNAVTGGGAEISMKALHDSLLKQGINSNLIALNKTEQFLKVKNVITLNRRWNSGLISTLCSFVEFKKVLKSIQADFLILNCELPELFGSLIRFQGRIICVEHTTKPWIKREALGRIIRTVLKLKKVTWVSVVRNQEKVWCGSKVFRHIPNPIIIQSGKAKEKVLPSGLIYVGGLKDSKRPGWVLQAGIELDLPVYVFGDGNLREYLEIKYKKYSNQISFFGFHASPWSVAPRNGLLIVPSTYEGDGMVVAEAILSKIPLALADNADLRRFGLENHHYFNGYSDLLELIKKNVASKFERLLVAEKVTNLLKSERSMNNITSVWLSTLRSIGGR